MSADIRYDAFSALSFDCYGTLIDWESGILAALAPWRARCGVDAEAEALLAAFARHESAVEHEQPGALYPDILTAVMGRISDQFRAPATAAECAAFGASVGNWPAFPDSAGALARLKQHFRLCVLSNVDKESFARSAARLGVAFDHVWTAQDIGSYKPDPRNFRYMIDRLADLGTPREQILHVAQSLYHDHGPAQEAGLRSVWIDRRAGRAGGATRAPSPAARFDARFETLAGFADAVTRLPRPDDRE